MDAESYTLCSHLAKCYNTIQTDPKHAAKAPQRLFEGIKTGYSPA